MAARTVKFKIVHEDEEIIVVDKPAGLLSVPIPGSNVKNLLDLVKAYAGNGGEIRSVHRIDRYTSGLMVFTKTEKAYDGLFIQFKNHTPVRRYLAVVRGIIEKDHGEFNHHLKRIKEGFRNIVVDPDEEGATPARLNYKVMERFLNTTQVEVRLDTGLKNQIRVQFETEGHQLVGDQHYAPEEEEEQLINRQALHAWKLEFNHPRTGQYVHYTAVLPPDMLRLIDYYRWQKELYQSR